MTWLDEWLRIFGSDPIDRTSREASVRAVLVDLLAGDAAPWFEPARPVTRGDAFLGVLWERAFGAAPTMPVESFVPRLPVPVPEDRRGEIPLRYRCVDLAFSVDGRRCLVLLDTEPGGDGPTELTDIARLAKNVWPDDDLDLVLVARSRPGIAPQLDDRQRYAELTWADVVAGLRIYGDDNVTPSIIEFMERELVPATDDGQEIDAASALTRADRMAAAVHHALRMAPAVEHARATDNTERGIDVAFPTEADARAARLAVKEALIDAGYDGKVGVWMWKPSSKGVPTTPAGHACGRELRLEPRVEHPVPDPVPVP